MHTNRKKELDPKKERWWKVRKKTISNEKMEKRRNQLPVTVQLILEKEHNILLLRRYQTGYEDGNYCLPGGHVDPGEEIKQAMVREAQEEIGVTIKKEDLKLVHILNRKLETGEYLDFIFQTDQWEGMPTLLEPDKSDNLIWSKKEELPSNIISYIPDLFSTKELYLAYGWEEEK